MASKRELARAKAKEKKTKAEEKARAKAAAKQAKADAAAKAKADKQKAKADAAIAKKAGKKTIKGKATPPPTYDRRYLDDASNPRRRVDDGVFVAPKVPQPYPAVRYHETDPPRTVQTEEEDKALGPGWSDTPTATATGTYPAWRYHHTKPPRLVNDKSEDDALGADWYPTVKAAAASAP